MSCITDKVLLWDAYFLWLALLASIGRQCNSLYACVLGSFLEDFWKMVRHAEKSVLISQSLDDSDMSASETQVVVIKKVVEDRGGWKQWGWWQWWRIGCCGSQAFGHIIEYQFERCDQYNNQRSGKMPVSISITILTGSNAPMMTAQVNIFLCLGCVGHTEKEESCWLTLEIPRWNPMLKLF